KADTIYFNYTSQSEIGPYERNDVTVVEDLVINNPVDFIPPSQCETGNFYTSITPNSLFNPGYNSPASTNFSRNETISKVNKEIIFLNGKIVFELEGENRQDFDYANT